MTKLKTLVFNRQQRLNIPVIFLIRMYTFISRELQINGDIHLTFRRNLIHELIERDCKLEILASLQKFVTLLVGKDIRRNRNKI